MDRQPTTPAGGSSPWHDAIYSPSRPAVLRGADLCPVLAGGQRAQGSELNVAMLQLLLVEEEHRYGHGEQPPVLVQHQPYSGPPLRYLLSGRRVKFCADRQQALHEYQTVPAGSYWPVPEYAAWVQGPSAGGVVRARINKTGGWRAMQQRLAAHIMHPQGTASCLSTIHSYSTFA